jgi:CRP-like cAMP-binding protein
VRTEAQAVAAVARSSKPAKKKKPAKRVGLASATEFTCPLSQYALADALGLSAIHINRVLRELRELKLLTVQEHKVSIHDRAALKALAGYDDIEDSAVLVRK